MFWGKRAEQRAAVDDARRACLQRGAVIYTALRSDDLDIDQYVRLSAEEFQALRMFLKDEHPEARLDCVWESRDGADLYRVRMDWDIGEITDL